MEAVIERLGWMVGEGREAELLISLARTKINKVND